MSVQSARNFVKDCLRRDDIAALRAGLGLHIPNHEPAAIDILVRRFETRWTEFREQLQEDNTMSDTIPIPLPRKMLWKVTLSDSLETPKTRSVLLVRGASSVFDAATKAKQTEGFAAFKEMFPNADVAGAEYAGQLEN